MERSKISATPDPKDGTVELLTARDITMDSYPKYAELPRNHSSGTGLHEISFVGRLRYWDNFLEKVRESFQETEWDTRPVSARLCPQDLNCTEHFRCGAEISTSSRYIANVLNPISGIAEHLGYGVSSGDWTVAGWKLEWPRITSAIPSTEEKKDKEKDKSSIPDYVLIDVGTKSPRALGEAKHPWGTTPDPYVKGARIGDETQEQNLRRFLGQLSRDMWAAKLQLGFMTNYTWTVFVRRARIDDEWILFFSDAIHHTTKSKISASNITVSVRECMLYYFQLAAGARSGWSLEDGQREPLDEWVKIKEKDPNARSKELPTHTLPQQIHRVPGALRPPTPTSGKTMELPQHLRKPGQGPKESVSAAAKRSEYRDVGELSGKGKFYHFMLDGRATLKSQDQWAMDPNNENTFYHDGDKFRGHLQGTTATPGVSQGISGKGKAKVDDLSTSMSSSTSNTQSQPSKVSNTASKPAAPKYDYIGRVPAGWTSYTYKGVDLPKSQWKRVGSYYYHDKKLLQVKEDT
ncbi:uncharacterized protein KD926_000713 [Aspergillus affinis]|uniref:uncharacterized protein n=1 Tax=Aspergillus affinis TaxID=1070780 RepID=UPI0022FEA540|nr:uncharacterized protein KD926_000713 [Aspergillus affinis]KAI9037208.1 hypothetical protein KD926_000713 [Aspergillus affinis]